MVTLNEGIKRSWKSVKNMSRASAPPWGHFYLALVCWWGTRRATGSSVHGIFQARILKNLFISSSKGSFWPRNQTQVSCISSIGRQIIYPWAIWRVFSEALQYKHSHKNGNPWWRVNWRVDWDRSCTYWIVLFHRKYRTRMSPRRVHDMNYCWLSGLSAN